MKSGIRILAIDDSSFRRTDKNVLVVGVVKRLDSIEGIISCRVEADGNDATAKIARMISGSRFFEQVKLIVINGTTVAGLNVVDIAKLHLTFKIPVIALTRDKPHAQELKRSIKSSDSRGYHAKAAILDRISKAARLERLGGFYLQQIGIESHDSSRYIADASAALRLAHMIASGVVRGESRGRV